MEFLYRNIGGKIKGLAVASAFFGAIGAFVLGIVLAITDSDLIIAGVIITFFGPIAAWVSSWVLYGFGQIICNLDKANQPEEKNEKTKVSKKQAHTPKPKNNVVNELCPVCNTLLEFSKNAKFVSCPNCKNTLEVFE